MQEPVAPCSTSKVHKPLPPEGQASLFPALALLLCKSTATEPQGRAKTTAVYVLHIHQ